MGAMEEEVEEIEEEIEVEREKKALGPHRTARPPLPDIF